MAFYSKKKKSRPLLLVILLPAEYFTHLVRGGKGKRGEKNSIAPFDPQEEGKDEFEDLFHALTIIGSRQCCLNIFLIAQGRGRDFSFLKKGWTCEHLRGQGTRRRKSLSFPPYRGKKGEKKGVMSVPSSFGKKEDNSGARSVQCACSMS